MRCRGSDPPLLIPGDTLVVRRGRAAGGGGVRRSKVHFARIQLGRDFGDRLEVLAGLEAGQRLVVNPGDSVREGVRVRPAAESAQRGPSEPRHRAEVLSLYRLMLLRPAPWRPPASPAATVPPGAALPRMSRPVSFDNSPRVHELMRAGNLYLSLQDALALAIENNLDIELERFMLPQSDTELLRAKGGGTLRGLNFTLLETPAGVGGPLSPVVTNAATTGRANSGTSVATNALALNGLGEAQTNLSMQGNIAQSNGTPVPVKDPAVTALVNWAQQFPAADSATTHTAPMHSYRARRNVNGGIQQGFSTGAQVGLDMVNGYQSWNANGHAVQLLHGIDPRA